MTKNTFINNTTDVHRIKTANIFEQINQLQNLSSKLRLINAQKNALITI